MPEQSDGHAREGPGRMTRSRTNAQTNACAQKGMHVGTQKPRHPRTNNLIEKMPMQNDAFPHA
eukprot:6203840-Pleurochrysis_carterae.AAC.1